MKTLQEQYNLIKEGKGHKSVFLKEAKSQFPGMINNAATFDQATHILKKRSVISENYVDLKPPQIEELAEVITYCEYHPRRSDLFLFSSSKGYISVCDLRRNSQFDHASTKF